MEFAGEGPVAVAVGAAVAACFICFVATIRTHRESEWSPVGMISCLGNIVKIFHLCTIGKIAS